MLRSSKATVRRRVSLAIVALLTVAGVASGTAAAPSARASVTTPTPVTKALDYVASCQRSDGGFAEKSGSASSESLTSWTIVALGSAGQDPNKWLVGGRSPVEYLAGQSGKWHTVTDYARTALAVRAADGDPRKFGGVDLIAKIRAEKQDHGADGDSFGPYVNTHIWALIALRSAGESATAREVGWLLSQQNADGGWGWAPENGSDTNDTAAALQALVASGRSASSEEVKRGLDYLRAKQNSDAGFSYSTGASDANSTAWVIQAILATGQDPGASSWKRGSANPVSALASLQKQDGSLRYTASQSSNPLLATVQAVPPLSTQPFPLRATSRKATAYSGTPVVALQSPSPGSMIPPSGAANVRLAVSDSDGTGIDSSTLKVKLDGKSAKAKMSGSTVDIGPVALGTGAHTVTVTVADHAGNTAKSREFRFTVATATSVIATTPVRSFVATGRATPRSPYPAQSSQVSSASEVATSEPRAEPVTAAPRVVSKRVRTVLQVVLAVTLLAAAVCAVALVVLRRRDAR